MTYSRKDAKSVNIHVYPIHRTHNGIKYTSLCAVLPKIFTSKLGIEARDTVKFSMGKNKIILERLCPEEW